ncbi:glycosyltransferase [Arenibacter certesii]|uniref:Glycosyl transferase n=1 Tax=Arenibacter certesii TaxID=228955 RepID=A0A918ILM9_9FLAO|nr:glycosyltransferase [Arenibacter certesii]GGW22061.1 glycosyl transferase [Arenibacter certesii]
MNKSRIIFFVTGLDSGGIENYLLRFLIFAKNNIKATIYTKSGLLGDLEQEYLNAGAELKPFKLGLYSVKDHLKLYMELKKGKFDALVDFTGNFAALPLLLAKTVGIPNRVVFYRGSTNHFKEDYLRVTYNNILNKIIPLVSTSILSNSKAALDFFFKGIWENDDRFKVIYNGIDANAFLSTKDNLRKELDIPSGAFVVGHVGRYNEAKNHLTMIQVAIELCKKYADVYFVFCGSKVVESLEKKVNQEGLSLQIKLLGYRKDIIKVLNTMDCFYFPSLTEGQPNALIEAMLVGLPFVASNINPIKETVPKIFHSQLLNPGDKNMAIEKIIKIKNNKLFAEELNLSKWSKSNFDSEKLFNEFNKVLMK